MFGLISGIAAHVLVTKPLVYHAADAIHNKVCATATSMTIPAHLYMPPNPQAPGKIDALRVKLPYLLAQRTTNYYHASASQAKNIELTAKRLDGVVIQPGQLFSYNDVVGPYTASNGFHWGRAFDGDRIVPSMGGGVCQGASTLYSALLRTDLSVVERHPHGLTVPYLPPGEDATVAESAHLDFRFRNTEPTPVLISAEALPDKRFLTVCIWGAQPAKKTVIRHRIDATYPYKTIHRHVDSAGEKKVLFPGQAGVKVDTWVEMKDAPGSHRKWIGTDTYLASPRIIATGKE